MAQRVHLHLGMGTQPNMHFGVPCPASVSLESRGEINLSRRTFCGSQRSSQHPHRGPLVAHLNQLFSIMATLPDSHVESRTE